MKIFVILLSFNSSKYIRKCLDSVLASSIPVETVVVENGSKDDSFLILKEYGERIHLLPQEKNLGFSGGNNVGISYALEKGADYLFLLNMDTYIEKDTIEKLYRTAENCNEKLLFCPLPKTFAGIFDLGFAQEACCYLTKHEFRNFVTDLYDGKKLKAYYKSNLICASALFLPISVIQECGNFCPLFYPAYFEDSELFRRVTFFGWSLAFVSDAVYYHDVEDRRGVALPDSHLISMRIFCDCLNLRNNFTKTFICNLVSEIAKFMINPFLLRFKNSITHFPPIIMLLKSYFPLKRYRKTLEQKYRTILHGN